MLLVAWYFPPDGGAGSQRPHSFATYLPELGWDVSVFTRRKDHARSRLESRDDGLLNELNSQVPVFRVQETGPMDGLDGCGEKHIAMQAGPFCSQLCTQVEQQQPAVVLISMSPFILSKAIPRLRARSKARIILDLRDPWALDYWPTTSRRHARAQYSLMLQSLSQIDGVILNTVEARKELFSVLGPHLPTDLEQRVTVIENGYSHTDFQSSVEPYTDRLLITHCGTFLCEQLKSQQSLLQRVKRRVSFDSRARIDRTGRTPFYLLEAAGLLAQSDPKIFDALRFRFVGHADKHLRDCVDRSPCPEKVELSGYQPHSTMIENLRSSTALFLPCGRLDDSVRELIVPGKTYEYLASARPIVAALHPGDALDLINDAGGNHPCQPCSSESIASALRALHSEWSSGVLDGPVFRDPSFLQRFDRSHLATRLSDFMDRVLSLPAIGAPR